ncbi:hypothetical protein C1645_824523 [Glomus cerebriforme]|uniref:Uncharacterized protein n=1 Tax=Glomus cerebriforme TaxID=658196 RepID=A0A397SYE7_9GLOM|nr:hypothetical protein C1645_824523 [Glomus cerebriforme]
MDMAKEYHPSNTFIGIDILSIFPNDENSHLPNAEIMEYNVNYYNPGPITLNRNEGIDPETTTNLIPQMMQSEQSLLDFNKQDIKSLSDRSLGWKLSLTKEEVKDIITSIIK